MPQKILLAFCLLITAQVWAQDPTQAVEMADGLRQSGKIYVVVGSIIVIFIGLLLFLFRIERQIKALEKGE